MGKLKYFVGPAGEVTFQVRARSCSQEMCPRGFLGKVSGRFNTDGDPSSLGWVLQGRSLSRSGPEVVHTKCV